MSPRVVTAIVGLILLGVVALFAFSGGGDNGEVQPPGLTEPAPVDRQAAPSPRAGARPSLPPETREQQRVEGFVKLQPTGGEVVVGKDPVPVYDLVTGEQRSQMRWMAEPLRAARAEKYLPNLEKRIHRKTVEAGQGLKMPTGSGRDRSKPRRDWYSGGSGQGG